MHSRKKCKEQVIFNGRQLDKSRKAVFDLEISILNEELAVLNYKETSLTGQETVSESRMLLKTDWIIEAGMEVSKRIRSMANENPRVESQYDQVSSSLKENVQSLIELEHSLVKNESESPTDEPAPLYINTSQANLLRSLIIYYLMNNLPGKPND